MKRDNEEQKDKNDMRNEENSHEELTEMPHQEESDNVNTEKVAEEQGEEKKTDWEAKYHELYDTYIRLFSEFDNFRKRSIREKSDYLRTAGADVMKSLIPVADDFERARNSMNDASDLESLKQGLELILNKFKNALTEKGLTEVNPVGEKFDPEMHEAITQLPAPSEDLKGTILDVVEKGYKMHDKMIRFPKVVVYS